MNKEDLEYLKEFCEFAEDKLTDTDIRAFQRNTNTDGLPHEVLNRYLFENDVKDSANELRKVGLSISEFARRIYNFKNLKK